MTEWTPPGPAQIPILCRHCMGRAVPRGDLEVICEHCGTRDSLPAEQRARALELQRRLAAAARSVVSLEGMDASLARMFESRGGYARAAGIYIAAAVLASASSIANAWPTIEASRAPAAAVMRALVGSVWLIGFALALLAAFAIGRRRYRRHVRPHLLARAPRQPGLPATCRTCGGELSRDDRGPFVTCTYCATRNLVTPAGQTHVQMLLDRERTFHDDRAGAALGRIHRISRATSRTLLACMAGTYVAIIALAALAS